MLSEGGAWGRGERPARVHAEQSRPCARVHAQSTAQATTHREALVEARGRRLRHCVPGRVTGEGFMRRLVEAVMDLGRKPLSVEVAPAEVGLTLRAKDSLTLRSTG